MITIPASLRTEVEKLRGRSLKARVKIDYSDANIDNTIVGTSYDMNPGSFVEQVYNGKEDVSYKWLALDGSWVLDETWALSPVTAEDQENYEMGWWSSSLANDDGDFVTRFPKLYGAGALYGQDSNYGAARPYPTIILSFLPRSFSQIKISFDNARMEYAPAFKVRFYDADLALQYTETVTGNAGVKYSTSITPLTEIAQITLEIQSWSQAGAAAKVAELLTAVTETYTGDDIFSISISEARQVSDQGEPTGSTAAGQCTIVLFNRFRKFDYDNTSSKLYSLVRENVRITPEIGDGTNWIPLGVYFAKVWDIPKLDIHTTVTGVDRMALLDETVFSKSEIISAPADQNYSTDSDAEWNAGTVSGVTVTGGAIRLT